LVLHFTALVFARALAMPNLKPAILTFKDMLRYQAALERVCQDMELTGFWPLMTIKITDDTTPEMIRMAHAAGAIAGKAYPADVTTGSAGGITDFYADHLLPVYATMEEVGMVLCLHGETPEKGVSVLDAEAMFLTRLRWLAETFPKLKIVFEHVSTQKALRCVWDLPDTVAATITAHHLVLTFQDVIGATLNPHHFCKPVPKMGTDRYALRQAAISGNPKIFFGSDSAPHLISAKESADVPAGIFSAPVALPVLAQVFEEEDALDKLEGFTSEFGAKFYGLQPNIGTIGLVKEPWTVPETYGQFRPFMAGETLQWRTVEIGA
jgi:dihydroorotase